MLHRRWTGRSRSGPNASFGLKKYAWVQSGRRDSDWGEEVKKQLLLLVGMVLINKVSEMNGACRPDTERMIGWIQTRALA